jgi:elongation factor P
MLSSLNDIKKGMNILYGSEPYIVMEANFVRMQQRKPVMQTKLKNLITGKVLEYSFKPGDRVEEADLRRGRASYLYSDLARAYFMSQENYEQLELSLEVIGDKKNYLIEGTEVDVLFFNDQPISLELPKKMELKVTSSPPGVRGDTAQGGVTKQVTLETGLLVNAPLFIKEGDKLRINTETGEYVERVS